jgi:hypothetical protein
MGRLAALVVSLVALTLSACCEDCGCRRERHCGDERPHNAAKPTEPWAR